MKRTSDIAEPHYVHEVCLLRDKVPSFENRTWRSRYRGRVILHASRTMDAAGVKYLREAGFQVPEALPMGAYVGEVTITDCRPLAECASRWAFGPWCYILERPAAYETPIPSRGLLGFYPVPEEVARALEILRWQAPSGSNPDSVLR